MRLRVFIIEPNETIRQFIMDHVTELGHEVIPARSVEVCPLDRAENACSCRSQVCADAIILGQEVPLAIGLDLVARRLRGGCKGAAVNSAIIFRPLSAKTKRLVEEVGCRELEASALLENVATWLHEVAERIPTGRLLVSLTDAGGSAP